ncbi:MAG: efflux RND transporter permease subunit [Gammaproteobacteria bacterium]
MKGLIDFFVDRYRTTLTMMFLVLTLGMYSYSQIPNASEPDIDVPFVIVSTFYEGVSPEDAERLISRPIEKRLLTVEDVKGVQSYSRLNFSTVIVEFPNDFDPDTAKTNIRDAVDEIAFKLPAEAEEPMVSNFNFALVPIMRVNLVSNELSKRELNFIAKDLQSDIEAIPLVLEANVVGVPEDLLEVEVDKTRLESFGITAQDFYNAISQNNRVIPAGVINTGTGTFAVKVPSIFEEVNDVRKIPLIKKDNAVIRIEDVASLRRSFKDQQSYAKVNGKNTVSVEIVKKTDANELDAVELINDLLAEKTVRYPSSLEIVVTEDRTAWNTVMLKELMGNVVTALVLVMAVALATMGIRSSLMVGAAIPLCFFFGMIILNAYGTSFNFLVCFGILISLGMLIDGAVVVIEFADRKMAEGLDKTTAYKLAARRMFWPVIASNLTTLAAFFPLLFWDSLSGSFLRTLIVTVFAVLGGSLIYALLFTPAIGSLFGSIGNRSQESIQNTSKLENGDPTELPGITGTYARTLNFILERPLQVLFFTILLVYTIFLLQGRHGAGSTFFVDGEPTFLSVNIEARGNLNASEKLELMEQIENEMVKIPEILRLSMYTKGESVGDPRSRGSSDGIGGFMVELPFLEEDILPGGRNGYEVLDSLRDMEKDFPGLKFVIRREEGGPPVNSPIEIDVSGRDSQVVFEATLALEEFMKNSIEGVDNVKTTIPVRKIEWSVDIDKEKASLFGVSTTEIGAAVQFLTNGLKLGEYRPEDVDDEVEIRVRYPESERRINQLGQLNIPTRQGLMPLSSFVEIIPKFDVPSIRRVDGERAFTVTADYLENAIPSLVTQQIDEWIDENIEFQNINFIFGGEQEEVEDAASFFALAGIISIFIMAMLLVTQLNSFYQAFVIVFAIILSTAGVQLGLFLTQSITSVLFTGLSVVALAGIVVNNNIVLVDTYNVLKRNSINLKEKDILIRTCAQRLRPVFLTSFTTVVGLLPLASSIGVDFISREIGLGGRVAVYWQPLAFGLVWGLSFATILTLFVTPAWLILPSRLREIFSKFEIFSKKVNVQQQ